MGYRLLGMAGWRGARWYLRRKYGPAMLPRPALALIVLGGIGVVAALARSRNGS